MYNLLRKIGLTLYRPFMKQKMKICFHLLSKRRATF